MIKLYCWFLCPLERGAWARGLASNRLFHVGENAGRDHVASCVSIATKKCRKKRSVEPDFLVFSSKIGLIHKKHMFFDKKYILFLAI